MFSSSIICICTFHDSQEIVCVWVASIVHLSRVFWQPGSVLMFYCYCYCHYCLSEINNVLLLYVRVCVCDAGYCEKDGVSVGFGECRGRVLPAATTS